MSQIHCIVGLNYFQSSDLSFVASEFKILFFFGVAKAHWPLVRAHEVLCERKTKYF